MSSIFLGFYSFLFGTLWGSFANVLIFRLPQGKSPVFPRSRCPQCQHLIKWHENIPILSFIRLRGKCSACHARIPVRYVILELVAGMASYFLFPAVPDAFTLSHYLFYFTVFIIFLCLFFIDLDHQILPDVLNFYLGLLFSCYAFTYLSWKTSLLGFFIGLSIPLLVTWLFYLARGKEGLGGGDIKLFAVLGIYLGPMGVLQNIFASCFLGSVVGGVLILGKKMDAQKPLPFGPFILIVAFVQIFLPNESSKLFSLFQ